MLYSDTEYLKIKYIVEIELNKNNDGDVGLNQDCKTGLILKAQC